MPARRVAIDLGHAGGVQWLWFSIVASVVLTVLLNVAIRLWPGAAGRSTQRLEDWAQRSSAAAQPEAVGDRRVRVVVPWKAMLLASVVATVVLNLVLCLA
jgi:hypothetical protein